MNDPVQPGRANDEVTIGATPGRGVSYAEAGVGDVGQRLDNYLMRLLKAVPKSHVYRVLRKGEVRVNGKRAKPETRLALGDRVRIPPVRLDEKPAQSKPSVSLQQFITGTILHEDQDLLIINKPAGVAVHGGSGLAFGVIEALRTARPDLPELELVHRLDRDTSGVLLVAKRRAALRELHAALREREMTKRYLALVWGRWELGKKKIELPLLTNQKQGGERMVRVHPEGQSALSTFVPQQHFGKLATLMAVEIGTGRTHQIRVHAAYAGHPVAGDEKYGNKEGNDALRSFGLRRMFLHAHSLEFARPGTGEHFSISAPLSEELNTVLTNLQQAVGRKSSQRI
ncbi:MAG: RluA family pseudouridine synthase [Steroidobacteraceae bacterium]